MAEYNVLAERWIPVEDLAGRQCELGLKDTLLQAHLLRRIIDPSPLITYGIQRMLIAFLMDALRPKHIEDLAALLARGRFDSAAIEEYVALCNQDGERFDLFSAERPFLQSRFDGRWDYQDNINSIAYLFPELPSGNNHMHFNHCLQDEHSISAGMCARALCAVSAFTPAGGRGLSPSINGAPPIYVLIKGETLFETLLLSMVARSEIPNNLDFDQPPVAWRNDNSIDPGKKVAITSLLYGITWQPRRILLIPEYNEIGQLVVKRMYHQSGLMFEGQATWKDIHVPYILDKEGKPDALRPNPEIPIWRDLHPAVLCNRYSPTYMPPTILFHYDRIFEDFDRETRNINLYVFGVHMAGKANFDSWFSDEISLDRKIFENKEKSDFAFNCIQLIDSLRGSLRYALKLLLIDQKSLARKKEKQFSREVIYSGSAMFYDAMQQYISSDLLSKIAECDLQYNWEVEIDQRLKHHIRECAMNAFNAAADRLGGAARHLELRNKAEKYLLKRTHILLKEGEKVDR